MSFCRLHLLRSWPHSYTASKTCFKPWASDSRTQVWFFGKYLAMDMCPLLQECHGSEVIIDWSREFNEDRTKETMDGLSRTSCGNLFQSEMVLGKNEYLYKSTQDGRIAYVSESRCRVTSRPAKWVAGNWTEDLCKKRSKQAFILRWAKDCHHR